MTKNHFTSTTLNLGAIAHQAMLDAGFSPDMPQAVTTEVQGLSSKEQDVSATRDLRSLLWSSIDDAKSRDLDQVEYVERLPDGDLRVLIGIADVAARVAQGSAIDAHAAANTTSVYTGVRTFPMLPEELSTDLTSLVGGADRTSIVTEMVVSLEGEVKQAQVYPARVHNYAKLSYEAVGAWLDGHGEMPLEVAQTPNMETQIRLQFEAARHLRALRKEHGALELETLQATPVVNRAGQPTDLASVQRNSARDIIENS